MKWARMNWICMDACVDGCKADCNETETQWEWLCRNKQYRTDSTETETELKIT